MLPPHQGTGLGHEEAPTADTQQQGQISRAAVRLSERSQAKKNTLLYDISVTF